AHSAGCQIFTDLKFRLPYLDQTLSVLIQDLYARGLDRKVLLIVAGEFSRMPRIETDYERAGRNHWPHSMSVIGSGGGLRTGQVIGATDRKGEFPVERPLEPNDVWATMFAHLGIDTSHQFLDRGGRPRA